MHFVMHCCILPAGDNADGNTALPEAAIGNSSPLSRPVDDRNFVSEKTWREKKHVKSSTCIN